MNISYLIARLRESGVKLYHVEGQLKVVAPKGRLDPELVHELKEHKQAVIHYLERSPGVVPYETITPIPRREHYDLSSGQRRLWILHQFKAERTSYNMPAAFSLEGDPDTQALKKAINALVRRYEILRTAFSTIEGEPKQFVHDTLEVPVRHSNPSPEDLETFIKKSAERVFDLDVAPLFRVELVTVSPGKHIFLFNMHHIISDGWSLPVFFRELGILYNAVTGEETPGVDEPGPDRHLPPLRIQYRDFAHWQNTYLTTASAERSQIYWHEKMSGQIPLLDLPSDHPRPPFKTAVGRTVSFQLDNALALGIHGCCNRREITPFMFLLAAVNLVIHRYTGQGDIITGSPIAGRNHLELEDQVGLYVNTLPLRNRVRGNDTVETFLQNVKQTATEAYENQNFPFDKLVDQLDLERHTNRNPLFDVMMTLQNNEPFVLELDGIKTTRLKTENTISRFDMTIDFYEEADNILMDIEYSAGLFEEDRILRFGNHFIQLVKSITTDTGQEVRHIDILSAEEKQQLLMEFNDTQVDFPEDKTIVTLFEDQVERTPDYTAVKSVSITYRHLNHQASRLAGLLKEKGVGPDTVVAVMMERSLEMIISLFGILKAGGAYLPIDPDYPEERIRYMLKDSNAILCISDNPGKGKNNDQLSMINYQLLMKSPALSEASEVKSESTDLAYILYTSGSTGRPKGVMLEHRSLVNRIHWMNKRYPINRGDVILQKTTYTFDVSVWELFWWSFYGASVYLLPPGDEKDPRRIIDAVCNHNITIMHFVPSMLSVFLESLQSPGDRLKCSSLKRVFASGEALTGKHAEDFAKTLGAANQTTLHNLYGPTEAAIDVTYFDCDRPVKGGAIPIGKPIANTRLYILDRHRALLPVGVAGEIVISGIGLARGYLNNPLLTNEKFEVRSSKFEVFYHTGDLGRWSADGNIEFLGRIDHQVKVRGYRIELEEIRHHLVSHSLIREAEVIVRSGQNELIAFVTGKLDWIADLPGMISGHLGKFLPAYMIPSLVVPLDRFPLTANGKVDRKALNVLSKDGSQIAASAEYAPPRNETEQKLVEIWESILQRKNIGIRDNFFNIGGHSLRATLAVSRIYKEFNVEFQLNQMFDTPTIEQIASSIETRHRGNHPHPGQGRQYEPVPPMEEREYYPLSHAQKRLWLINRFGIENNIAYNMPAAHYFNGPLDIDVFKQAFRAMIQRHQILRTGFIETRGKTWQKVFETVDFNLEILTLPSGTTGAEPEKRIETITRQHSETPFDLSQFPLFSAKLLEISPHRHLFLFNAHHIINDGWSINIFNRELTQLYNAYNRDPRCPSDSVLPKPGIQYKDYAHWQNNYLQTRFMKDQEQYWLGKLSGHRPHLDFPTDFNRPTVKNYNGISIFHTLDRPLTDGIKRLCNSSGVTLFMILVAFTKILLYRYTGQEDIITGSPIAGRNHPDLEDQLGFYVNTLALRDRVAGDHTFESVLRQVKQTTVEAYENQDYPFDKLVDQLNPDRDRSRHPLFEIMVVLQNTGKLDLTFDQLQVTAAEIYFDISKFDLTFNFDENERTGETRMVMDYNTGLFNQDRIHRLCRHFTRMVQSILQNPGTAVREVEILTGKEKNQLLEEFNGPDSPVPNEATITSLFEEQVNRTPESVAVVGMDPASGHGFSSSLTYKELGQTANRLAFQLKEYGVGPGTIVAIMVERSIRMVIGIMAILKAGGAYLPIEPDYPEDRVGYMLKDSNARVLLKSRRDQIRNPKFETNPNDQNTNDRNKNQCFPCVILDFEHFNLEFVSNFEFRISDLESSNLAYITYTSGSTGRPKGVMIEHRNVVSFNRNLEDIYRFETSDIIYGLTTYTFDISVLELICSLLSGIKCVIGLSPRDEDAYKMEERILNQCVTLLQITPTILSAFIDTLGMGFLERIRVLLIGGEAFPTELFNKVQQLKGTRVFNVYGPTETTIWSSSKSLNNGRLDIGTPLVNESLLILSKDRTLMPIGCTGEIYIGGEGVGGGYLNRPQLTGDAFIPHPYKEGQRVYGTGDLGRWLPSGDIECLGRTDHQVKVRGFRIELGEIEYQLCKHPLINEAVVTAAEINRQNQLAAYIVAEPGLDTGSAGGRMALREHLGKFLPGYMIPACFIQLEKLPLTSNGKIDKNALAAQSTFDDSQLQTHYTPPRNPIEKTLTAIWQEILQQEKISITDNFFDLGGYSLKATQVVSRVHKELSVEITLRDLFNSLTIADLAVLIKGKQTADYTGIPAVEKREYYDLSHTQTQLWLSNQFENAGTGYNMPSAFTFEGELDILALNEAFRALIHRHEILRTGFITIEGVPKQKVYDSVDFSIRESSPGSQNHAPHAPHDPHDPRDPEILVTRHATMVFDLTRPPLMDVKLLEFPGEGSAATGYILLLNMHHIISDAWSFQVFLGELTTLYHAFLKGESLLLPPLGVQYKDYTAWQNDLLESDKIKISKDYWHRKLSGKLPGTGLPTDFTRPAEKTFDGLYIDCSLNRDLTSGLSRLSRSHECSLFIIMLALVKVFIYRYSGEEDIAVGSPIAGRDHMDLEKQIGFYVNTLVLRDGVKGDEPFSALLDRVKQTAFEAYENNLYPYDKLVDDLNASTAVNRNPFFDVILVQQNNEEAAFKFDRTANTSVVVKPVVNPFDLTVIFMEKDGEIAMNIGYKTRLFKEETPWRFIDSLTAIAASVVEDQEIRLADIEIISETERKRRIKEIRDHKDVSFIDAVNSGGEIIEDNANFNF